MNASRTLLRSNDLPALGRSERAVLFVSLVVLYSALPTAIVRDILRLGVPLWPLYFSMYALVGTIIVQRLPRSNAALAPMLPLLLYSALPLVSLAWSEAPGETLLQALTLLGTVLVGLSFATVVRPRDALALFAAACVTGSSLDLLVSVALPHVGVHQDGPWAGTMKGLHDQKNGLGAISTIAIMVLVTSARAERRLRLMHVVGLLLAGAMLAASKSTTSWLVAICCTPFLMLWPSAQRAAALIVPPAMTAVIAALVLVPDLASGLLEALPQLVGKDSSLSNRLPIWIAVEPFMADRWWLGFGYGAFWSSSFLPVDLFQTSMFFVPTSAHSSYIEVRLAFGIVGLAATLALLLTVVMALAVAHLRAGSDGADPVLPMVLPYVLFITLTSLTESVLMQRNTIMWVTFVWLAATAVQCAYGRSVESGPRPSRGTAALPIA